MRKSKITTTLEGFVRAPRGIKLKTGKSGVQYVEFEMNLSRSRVNKREVSYVIVRVLAFEALARAVVKTLKHNDNFIVNGEMSVRKQKRISMEGLTNIIILAADIKPSLVVFLKEDEREVFKIKEDKELLGKDEVYVTNEQI